MLAGITIFRPDTCDIDADVEIGTDTVIEPFVQLIGKTKIGADCRIRSYSVITNCEIGDNVLIRPGCILEDSVVRHGAQLARTRTCGRAATSAKARMSATLSRPRRRDWAKARRRITSRYLGDAEIGEGVNMGAGTITCNYDGVNKHQTIIDRRSVYRQRCHARRSGPHWRGAPMSAQHRALQTMFPTMRWPLAEAARSTRRVGRPSGAQK